jgi:hypothetical protein
VLLDSCSLELPAPEYLEVLAAARRGVAWQKGAIAAQSPLLQVGLGSADHDKIISTRKLHKGDISSMAPAPISVAVLPACHLSCLPSYITCDFVE